MSECLSPNECKDRDGKCAERMWHPTVAELQQEIQRRKKIKSTLPRFETVEDLSTEETCSAADTCKHTGKHLEPVFGICSRKRGMGGMYGTLAVVRLGLNDDAQK